MSPAGAQNLVKPADVSKAMQILDHTPSRASLPCYIQIDKTPRLDFEFRYTESFLVECRLGGVIQPGTRLISVLRITPRQGEPVLMMENFAVPPAQPHNLSTIYALPSQMTASMSGGFAMGPGRYSFEMVVTDLKGHTCRKQIAIKPIEDRGARAVPFAIEPGAVAPLMNTRWTGALHDNGLRVTIFLNAYVPNRYTYLQVLDRSYLVQSLDSLLTQLPCKSVRLVAFELDRQLQFFRSESLDPGGFLELQRSLQRINYASISYKALMKDSWRKFLVDLVQTESARSEPPDAIIFLGAWGSHEWDKLPEATTREIEVSNAHVFYFELFPLAGGAPDGVERLTKDLHGTIFAIRSADTLAGAIKKTEVLAATAPDQEAGEKSGAGDSSAH